MVDATARGAVPRSPAGGGRCRLKPAFQAVCVTPAVERHAETGATFPRGGTTCAVPSTARAGLETGVPSRTCQSGGKCERGGWPPLSQERQRESALAADPGPRLWFSRVQDDAASSDSRHEVPFGLGGGALSHGNLGSEPQAPRWPPPPVRAAGRPALPSGFPFSRWTPGGESVKGGAGPPFHKRDSANRHSPPTPDRAYGSAGYRTMRRVPIRGTKCRSGWGWGPSLAETRFPNLKLSDGPHPQPDQRAVPKQGFEP